VAGIHFMTVTRRRGTVFLAITTQIIGLWRATFYYNHSLKPASLAFVERYGNPNAADAAAQE
jgi:hypothetical protein